MNIESATNTNSIAERIRAGYLSIGRPPEDIEANELRKPDQVLEWLGVEEGMSIIDLGAARGYYSENLAWAVGLNGWVILQNPPGDLDWGDSVDRIALDKRLAGNRLPQIETTELFYTDLPEEYANLDGATFVNTFHDLYNFEGEELTLESLKAIYQLLKPGGFFLVIDHLGTTGNDNGELHRIEPRIVKTLLAQAGFEMVAESELLAIATDDPSLSVFDPSVRGKTHRFIFKAIKPAG